MRNDIDKLFQDIVIVTMCIVLFSIVGKFLQISENKHYHLMVGLLVSDIKHGFRKLRDCY